ncbi:hypothetical protein [Embleya sp. AB8]|uniref:hypothetical protein n=1 Tax=Embleya sp. AB8 TaxID=3156304 RepID=UPI003C75F4FA
MDKQRKRTHSAPKRAHHEPVDPAADQAARTARWGKLPDRPDPAALVEEQPADPPNDPDFGRNPDRDWMLRYTP